MVLFLFTPVLFQAMVGSQPLLLISGMSEPLPSRAATVCGTFCPAR
jgi:hypothetical protein